MDGGRGTESGGGGAAAGSEGVGGGRGGRGGIFILPDGVGSGICVELKAQSNGLQRVKYKYC